MSQPQENVAIVLRWFEEIWNQRRYEVIAELMTVDAVCQADDGVMNGHEGFLNETYLPMVAAFPDLKIQIDGTVAEGDQVVVRWTAHARHTGEGLGFRATGDRVTFRGMTWVTIQDGKMHSGWQTTNLPVVLGGLATKAATLP